VTDGAGTFRNSRRETPVKVAAPVCPRNFALRAFPETERLPAMAARMATSILWAISPGAFNQAINSHGKGFPLLWVHDQETPPGSRRLETQGRG
jgi:hypothetical protein